MAAEDSRSAMRNLIDALVFAGLAFAVLIAPGNRRGFSVLALLAIAFFGYWYASKRLVSRVVGILAFLIGWVFSPLAGLAGLSLVAFFVNAGRLITPEAVAARQRVDVARFTLRTAIEVPGRIRAFRAPFVSSLGPGEIPMLMATTEGEVAFYVETGPWTETERKRFLDWIALLRASDRTALPVEVRSVKPVPDDVLRACRLSPDVLAELARRPVPSTSGSEGGLRCSA